MKYENAIRKYMHGKCMFLAAALHHTYGFGLGMTHYFCGMPHLYHAWAVMPDRQCLDIQGVQTVREVVGDVPERLNNFLDIKIKVATVTTLRKLERACGYNLSKYEPKIKTALEEFNLFFAVEPKTCKITFHGS